MHHTTDATLSLWARARAMFARAMAALGGAAAIASLPRLSSERRGEIIAWLAPLEHIARKLLLAEAAVLHRAERAPPALRIERVPLAGMARHCRPAKLQAQAAPGVAHKCAPEDANVDRSHPESWRAPFSFAIPRDRQRVDEAHAPRIRPLWGAHMPTLEAARTPRVLCETDSPIRLARRIEALRRVLENPRPHAERLARFLARETGRRSEVVRTYLFAPCRANGHDPDDPRLTLDAISHAFDAPQAFDST